MAGLEARQLAARLVDGVLARGHALEDVLESEDGTGRYAALEPRDRAFARLVAATVLRRHGSLSAVLAKFLERPLPKDGQRAQTILLSGAAQILLLETPAHAAINLAVEQCRHDVHAGRYAKLANAVLRRVATDGPAIIGALDRPRIDIPKWMWARWVAAYGEKLTNQIAAASLAEAPLDISANSEPEHWASQLGGKLLATGSIRLAEHGRIEDLPGFVEGAWWVQDAAAALPARLLGNVAGRHIADLCAAPGGKTAALASAGARVTAVDVSANRLARLSANMQRLGLTDRVDTVTTDILTWNPPTRFDAVLLDAPCTATGTIRRHPDIVHLKRPEDLQRLAKLQAAMINKAAELVTPGGTLVYCTCSLEPEEGPHQIERFLASNPQFARKAVIADEIDSKADWISPSGDLRTLPCHWPSGEAVDGGMDGFFAARLVRRPS